LTLAEVAYMPNRIPLDPKLPKTFNATPNEARAKSQLDAWRDRPYGVTLANGGLEVRCLNGGVHDRSTHLGVANDYDAVCALAEAKQAEWLKFRERPLVEIDKDPQQLAAFQTMKAASEYLSANFPKE